MQEEKQELFETRYEELMDKMRNKPGFADRFAKLTPEAKKRFEIEMTEFLKNMAHKIHGK